jgi:hypothetical protein
MCHRLIGQLYPKKIWQTHSLWTSAQRNIFASDLEISHYKDDAHQERQWQ